MLESKVGSLFGRTKIEDSQFCQNLQFWESKTLWILKLDIWKLILSHDINRHKNWFKYLFRTAMDGMEFLDHSKL